MIERYRKCAECGKEHELDYYLPCAASSLYSKDGRTYICMECISYVYMCAYSILYNTDIKK